MSFPYSVGHWWHVTTLNKADVRRSAEIILRQTGQRQVFHWHGPDRECPGAGCTELHRLHLGAGEELVAYDRGRARTLDVS